MQSGLIVLGSLQATDYKTHSDSKHFTSAASQSPSPLPPRMSDVGYGSVFLPPILCLPAFLPPLLFMPGLPAYPLFCVFLPRRPNCVTFFQSQCLCHFPYNPFTCHSFLVQLSVSHSVSPNISVVFLYGMVPTSYYLFLIFMPHGVVPENASG